MACKGTLALQGWVVSFHFTLIQNVWDSLTENALSSFGCCFKKNKQDVAMSVLRKTGGGSPCRQIWRRKRSMPGTKTEFYLVDYLEKGFDPTGALPR